MKWEKLGNIISPLIYYVLDLQIICVLKRGPAGYQYNYTEDNFYDLKKGLYNNACGRLT